MLRSGSSNVIAVQTVDLRLFSSDEIYLTCVFQALQSGLPWQPLALPLL